MNTTVQNDTLVLKDEAEIKDYTEFKLSRMSQRVKAAEESIDSLREERDLMVRSAKAAGLTVRQIAEATGLTQGRIGQLTVGIGKAE